MNKLNLYKQQSAPHLQHGTGQERYVHASERPWMRRIARGMAALLLIQATWLAIPAYAQVTPNTGAPAGQRPLMDAAQNGVPIVHIAPPSAGGVSRNQYQQFNVAPNGLILNNSPAAVQTQQGGWITGNMQLGPTPARIILNEVVGANPSQLRGTIEVAGQRADIVIANPNGITCDGCGFLNTGRATMTTGQTQFNGDESIRGFDVRQGQINIGSYGLNAANLEQIDLISRGIVIEGEVWAKNLNVLAGSNQVLYGTLQATAQGGSGPAPQFSIDIKNLGGMYANQVYLVSSELGVGVNSTGRMAALQGNLVLSANGDLSLKDTYAKQKIQINGANVALAGQTQSEGATAITASGGMTNQSAIDAGGQLTVNAASITNNGSIAQRNTQGATLNSTGNFTNAGTLYTAGPIAIQSAALNNSVGKIGSAQALTVQAASLDNTDGELGGNGISVTSTSAVNNTRGKIVSDGNLTLNAASLNNTNGIVSGQQAANVRLGSGTLDNTQGQLVGSQSLALQSGEIRNSAGVIASGAGLSLDTQGAALTNTANGQIVANGDLTIASAGFDNRTGTTASINGRLQVNTNGQSLQNDGGKLQAAGNTTITAGTTSNQSGLITGQDITVTNGTLNNDNGQVVAGGTLTMGTQSLSNNAGLLQSVGNAQINTNGQALTNTASGNTGGIVAGGTLALNTGSVNNQAGFIASNSSQTLTVSGDLDNRAASGQAGQIVSNADTTITAANVNNQSGAISALGNVGIATGLLDNRGGTIAANGNAQISSTTLDNRTQNGTAGTIDATDITVTSATIDNRGGTIRGGRDATLASTTLDNTGGSTTAVRSLTLTSTGMANAGGRMVANQAVTINSGSQTLGGTVASSNNVTLNVTGDYNNTGLLSAQNDLTLNATNITNSGTLTATNNLTANTGNLTNSGEISAQAVTLNASGTLTNTATGLIDSTDTRINAGTVSNTGRIYGDMLRINAGTVNNSGTGVIAARNTLLIGAQNINNTNGALIYSLGNMGIGGSIDANGQLQGSAQSLVNASAKIEAGGTLSINSTTILNRNDGLVTTQVADAPVHTEKVQPNGSGTQYPVSQCSGIGGGQDGNNCIVYPDKYGQRSTVLPITSDVCTFDPNNFIPVCTTQVNYSWNDPMFARFGVATVSSPPPSEPAGGCTTIDINTGMPVPLNSPACNQWNSDYATWNTGFQATLVALDAKITPYNAEVNEDNRVVSFEDYTWYKVDATRSRTVVASTAPGQILSAGAMNITGSITNRDSTIVAGGALSISGPAVSNIATQGEDRTDYSGTSQFTEVVSCGTFGGSHCRNWYGVNNYSPAPTSVMVDLPTVRFETLAGNQTTVRTIATATGTADTSVANAAQTSNGSNRNASGQAVQATLASGTPSVLTVPNNSLFLVNAAPGARYLVETDPRFTNFRTFISSDYFLQTLSLDPSRQMKRYGDGFMEQQLVNDQILALTGRRFLDGYASTETEYKGLMDAGVAFAQQYQLTPGVKLSAEQMALLTTDIVWLIPRTVTLADGSTQQVLAPQVYLRRPNNGDLQSNGTLIAGSDVLIQTTGNLVNSGTISGSTVTALAGNDLVNQGGRIGGNDVFLRANNDLKNLSGVIHGTGTNSTLSLLAGRDIVLQTQTKDTVNNDGTSSRTSVQRIATIQGGDIQLAAGRDFTALGTLVAADNKLTAIAGRDIKIAAVADEYQLNVQDRSGRSTQGRTAYISEATTKNQIATMTSGGDMTVAANGNVNLKGANFDAGSAVNGNLIIQGQNVSIEAVKDRAATDIQTIGAKSYNRVARESEVLAGGVLSAGNDITVLANGTAADGNGNIALTGANIVTQNGQVALAATRDITIANDTTHHSAIDESYVKSGTLLKTTTSTTSNKVAMTQVEGSVIIGNTVVLQAGNDVAVRGSSVIGLNDVGVQAGNNVAITSAQGSYQRQQSREETTSGFTASYSAGVASIGFGKSSNASQASVEAITQQGSSIGSLDGNARIQAAQQLTVIASDISAGKDLALIGKSVDLSAAQNTSVEHSAQQSKSSGFSIGITVDPFAAFKNAYQESGKNNKSTSAIGKEFKRAEATADGILAASTPIVIQAGSRSANATQDHATSDAKVSTLKAGGDLTILATDGSINSQGTSISAEGDTLLLAKKHITLDVAHNLESQSQDDKASGWSFDNRGSLPIGVFNSKGNGLGDTDTITGTNLSVGGKATLATTEGDITITGSNVVANGDTVINAARNLTLQSGQDSVANDNHSDSKAIGKVVISDTERFAGFHKQNHNDSQDGITQIDSNVASLQGNVTLTAGDKYTQKASNVLAANDISISGKTIDITTAANSGKSAQDNSDLKIGMFARISSPIIDLVNNIEGASKSDGRLQAMQGMAAAANAYQAVSAASGGSGALIKGEVGIGFASSSSQDQTSGSQAQGSTIKGSNNVTLTSTEGNIHATGSSLAAGKTLALDSAKDILLDAGQSTANSSGNNRSAGVEVGVGFSVGAQTGVYAYVAANAGHGDYNNTATINSNTHLTGETVTLQSKGDTTLKGADVKADTINADVKGKLAIESVQDTVTQHSAQSNVGVRVQVSFGTAWEASGSFSKASGDSSATYVNEQSGLFAGNGGYHINADTVDLKGGAITSTNAANSALTANALTFSNLENKMEYKSGSLSLAGSMSGGSGASDTNADGSKKPEAQQQTFGSMKSGNVTPGLPMQEKGSARSTTYATLTDGTITIGGKTTDSAKDLGINTDASIAHTKIVAAPDIKALMKEQQAISAAAGTVIATSKQVANDIAANAAKTQQAAQKVLDNPNSSDEEKAQAKQTIIDALQTQKDWGVGGKYNLALAVATGLTVDSVGSGHVGAATANAVGAVVDKKIGDLAKENKWEEGSPEKIILHGMAGLIQAKIGGTNELSGFAAGSAKEALTPVMESFLVSQGYKQNTPAFNDMMKLGSVLVGAAAGAVVGGNGQNINAGANIALNAEVFNRQLHPDEKKIIRTVIAKKYAKEHPGVTEEQAAQLLEAQLLRQVDAKAGAASPFDFDAARYLNNYKAEHQGATVGVDQWGNPVPLFGTAAGYQRLDSTIFSANPQTKTPPPDLNGWSGVTKAKDYVVAAGSGFLNKITSPFETARDSLFGTIYTVLNPEEAKAASDRSNREIMNEAAAGNFKPAGNQMGEQVGSTVVNTVVTAGTVKVIGATASTAGRILSSEPKGSTVTALNSEVLDTSGNVLAKQNPLTGNYEPVTTPISTSVTTTATRSVTSVETGAAATSSDTSVVPLFRGTTEGYAGSPGLQKIGVTPTSVDAAVATVFATESSIFGTGVVHIATPKDLAGVTIIPEGNASTPSLARTEAEVAVNLKPTDFAQKASVTITDSQARAILSSMGIDIPANISKSDITSTLQNTPKLTPEQTQQFIDKAREISVPKSGVSSTESVTVPSVSNVKTWESFQNTTVSYLQEKPGFFVFRNFNEEAFGKLASEPEKYTAKTMAESSVKTDGMFIRVEQADPVKQAAVNTMLENSAVYGTKTVDGVAYLTRDKKIIVSDPDPAYIGKTELFSADIPKTPQYGIATPSQVELIQGANGNAGVNAIQHGPQNNINVGFVTRDFPMTAISPEGVVKIPDQRSLDLFLDQMLAKGYRF